MEYHIFNLETCDPEALQDYQAGDIEKNCKLVQS